MEQFGCQNIRNDSFDFDNGVIGRYKTKYKRGLGTIIKDPYNDNYLWSLGNDDAPGLCRFNRSTGMFKYL